MTTLEFILDKVKDENYRGDFGLNKLPYALYPIIEKLLVEYREFENWKIECTEKFYYQSGRFTKDYIEISYWYNPVTLERKDIVRKETVIDGQNSSDWTKECGYRMHLNYDY